MVERKRAVKISGGGDNEKQTSAEKSFLLDMWSVCIQIQMYPTYRKRSAQQYSGLILRQFRISLFFSFIHTILFHIVEVELIKLLYTKFPDGKPTTLILLSYILRANTNQDIEIGYTATVITNLHLPLRSLHWDIHLYSYKLSFLAEC